MRHSTPDPLAIALALSARVDVLERQREVIEELRVDVAALGHGLADLTRQLRQLTAARTATALGSAGQRPQPSPGSNGTSAAGAGTAEDEEAGQPDWLPVPDTGTAVEWLTGVATWSGAVLAPLGLPLDVPCWSLHPRVVTELLALRAEHASAYADGSPTAVCEWLGRWLPGAGARIATELSACRQERGHRHRGATYDASGLALDAVASWWVATRGDAPDAVEAFSLSRLS